MCCRASVNWFWRFLYRSIRAEITRCRTSDDFVQLEPFPEYMLSDLRRCNVDLELALLNEYKLSILFDEALIQFQWTTKNQKQKTTKINFRTWKSSMPCHYQGLLSLRFSSNLAADMIVPTRIYLFILISTRNGIWWNISCQIANFYSMRE